MFRNIVWIVSVVSVIVKSIIDHGPFGVRDIHNVVWERANPVKPLNTLPLLVLLA